MEESQAKKIVDFLVDCVNAHTHGEHKHLLYTNYILKQFLDLPILKCEIGLVLDSWRMFLPLFADISNTSRRYFSFNVQCKKQEFEAHMYSILLDELLAYSATGYDIVYGYTTNTYAGVFLKANTSLEELLILMAIHGYSAE